MSEPYCEVCSNSEGGSCDRRTADCPVQRQGALDAGIPLSVIEGKSKLTDHFSKAFIDMQCGREPLNEEDYFL